MVRIWLCETLVKHWRKWVAPEQLDWEVAGKMMQ